MPVKATAKLIRMSPQKVRLVTRILPGKDVGLAEQELKFLHKGAADPVLALLRSATANAENNFDMEKGNLFVKEVMVNEGPTYKRWRARSRGMAAQIAKRTSHISIVLDEKEPGKKTSDKKKATAKKADQPKVVKLKSRDEIKKLGKEAAADDKDKKASDQKLDEKTGYFQKRREDREKKGQQKKGMRGFVDKMFRRKSEG